MSTSPIIDTSYLVSNHPHIGKRTNVANLALSITLIVLGIAAFLTTFLLKQPSSAVGMALMVVGIGLFVYGAMRLVRQSRSVVFLPTQSALKKHTLYFDLKELHNLKELVENRNFSAVINLKSTHSGNVRMDVLLSGCNGFAAVQLFQFVPYNYTPVTDITYYTNEDAQRFALFLRQSSTK
ncbi:MAG: hypothetical protein LBM62_06185 [Mediterranea sp.]|nr:hypothetical protein [Mediterranea sp.]